MIKHPNYVQKIVTDGPHQREIKYIYPVPSGKKPVCHTSRGFVTKEGFTTFEFHFDFNVPFKFDLERMQFVAHYAALHQKYYGKAFQSV